MGAYVIYLNEYKSIGTHWIALHVNELNCMLLFIDFMLEGKSLLDYANLFCPNE